MGKNQNNEKTKARKESSMSKLLGYTGNLKALTADRIIVLDRGKVVEQGRPEDLLADDNSIFRHMASLQMQSAAWGV